jgi:molybdenum cofactor sulfurtransferase
LVADAFPWTAGSTFQYTRVNHTSVLGIRGGAMAAGAAVAVVDILPSQSSSNAAGEGKKRWRIVERGAIAPEEKDDSGGGGGGGGGGEASGGGEEEEEEEEEGHYHHSLFAYPAECNLSGERYDPDIAAVARGQEEEEEEEEVFSSEGGGGEGRRRGGGERRRRRKWWVLCDAAKAAALHPPDLSRPDAPDFLVCSFYKIFGYPSGVGALVARRSALALLRPRYFGGGTVGRVQVECSLPTA